MLPLYGSMSSGGSAYGKSHIHGTGYVNAARISRQGASTHECVHEHW
jgi:hypothetical protein